MSDIEKTANLLAGVALGFFKMAEALVEASQALQALGPVPDTPEGGVIHRCPPKGSGVMPCCGRNPLEVSEQDRITAALDKVTCNEGRLRTRRAPE